MWQATLRTVTEGILGVKTHGKILVTRGTLWAFTLLTAFDHPTQQKTTLKKKKVKPHWRCETLPHSPPHTPLTDVTFWRRTSRRAVRRPQQHGHGIYHGSKCEEGDQPWLGYETELRLRLGTLKRKGHVFPFPRRFKRHDIVLLKMTWKSWEANHKNEVIISPLWPVTIMKRITVHSTGFTTPAASSHFIRRATQGCMASGPICPTGRISPVGLCLTMRCLHNLSIWPSFGGTVLGGC